MVRTATKIFLLLALAAPAFALAQNIKKQAHDFFGKYRNQRSLDSLCIVSAPTLEDCRAIFTAAYADSFYRFTQKIPLHYQFDTSGAALNAGGEIKNKQYPVMKIETALLKDIIAHKNTEFDISERVRDKIKPETELVKVSYREKEDDKDGPTYRYWVLVGKKWVFLYKPARAFLGDIKLGKKK